MDDLVFIGDWVKDRVLGSGSFGTVVLWKHKKTEEHLAIKTCKWGDELTPKHRERWTKEVEMLKICNNPNIVGTKDLPPEFVKGLERANPSKLPILCMEYCTGGDLRQLLNKPEACVGLKEVQIRHILSDITNAMQFLHNNKITHRDLKPENVVMTLLNSGPESQGTRKATYKLIDLGYAKEIDSNSVCASFVGTLQYLAPELIYSKTYSNSVDYWSFGLLAFEIICGTRPFLPFMAPVQWIPHIKKKSHDTIAVYETFHGDIEYSNECFSENNITKPFKDMIEKWLAIALEWDPKLRGRNTATKVTFNIPAEAMKGASKIVIFDHLEEILTKKIIRVFSVFTLSQHAFVIDNETTVSTLKTWLLNETKISISEQTVITQSYIEVANDDSVIKYWNENFSTVLFLFSKKSLISNNVELKVPLSVQRCLEHPKTLYNFKNSQTLYRHGYYFVTSQMEMYDLLINGIFARSESLKHISRQLLMRHNDADKSIGKIVAKEEIVNKMTDIGQKHIDRIRDNGKGTNFLGGFEKLFKDATDVFDKIDKLLSAWSQLTVRLQSAARRTNEILSTDLKNFVSKYNFQTLYTNACKAYINHKKGELDVERRSNEKQCHDVMKICYDCLKLRSKILTELQNQPFFIKLMDLTTEFDKIEDIIVNASETTDKLTTDLSTIVDELTNCMWSTISLMTDDSENLADLPYSVISFQKRDFKIEESLSMKPENNIPNGDDLNSLILESARLRKCQKEFNKKLNMHNNLIKENKFDFSFLKDNSD